MRNGMALSQRFSKGDCGFRAPENKFYMAGHPRRTMEEPEWILLK